jgi:chromosome segregation ATPase
MDRDHVIHSLTGRIKVLSQFSESVETQIDFLKRMKKQLIKRIDTLEDLSDDTNTQCRQLEEQLQETETYENPFEV